MAIQKINKEDIDFSKIYSTKYDADNEQNNVKVNEIYWGDNGDLYFDDETGMISENGVGLGFTNVESINKEVSNNSNSFQNSRYNGAYSDDNDIMKQEATVESINNESTTSSESSGKVGGTSYFEDADIAGEGTPIESIGSTEETVSDNEVVEEVKVEEPESNTTIESIDSVEEVAEETQTEEQAPEEQPAEEIESIESTEETVEEVEEETKEEETPQTSETPSITGIRNMDEINAEVERFGGNGGHNLYQDAKNSGNEAVYIENINNLLNNLEGVEQQFASDGQGYSFQSTVFSGGGHATGSSKPTHGMGAKADLRFYKNGVQLDVGNATSEDWTYIKSVLGNNNLGVQFEKHNTVWGDVFLNQAKNVNGDYVTYDGSGWGSGIDIHYTK